MNSAKSVCRYAGVAATAMWMLGWVVTAYVALRHLNSSPYGTALLNAIVTVAFSAFGCAATVRLARRIPAVPPEEPTPTESWPRRMMGWFAGFVWVTVAMMWTLAVDGCLFRAAHAGDSITVLVLIPFSLIGWFLLLVRFVSAALTIDCILRLISS
jgi:hypothetical protein